MKIFNYYSDSIDRTWYQSSNIKYTECEDVKDDFKKLKVVFNSGKQYLYEDVSVLDYIGIREAPSQGQALNKWLKEKKPKYVKLEDANLQELEEEYKFRSGNGVTIINHEGFKILDNKDNVVFEKDKELNEETLILIIEILTSFGKVVQKID